MSGALPRRINPFRLAEQGACLQGTWPIALMSRLCDALISREGEVEVQLKFARDEGDLNVVIGEIRVSLEMQCQRCLRPAAKMIDRRFRLAMTRSDAEALRLQTEHETLEVQDEAVFTKDLIEDELLLSLPLVPTHDDPQACDAAIRKKLNESRAERDSDNQRPTRNPFAMLKDLNKV